MIDTRATRRAGRVPDPLRRPARPRRHGDPWPRRPRGGGLEDSRRARAGPPRDDIRHRRSGTRPRRRPPLPAARREARRCGRGAVGSRVLQVRYGTIRPSAARFLSAGRSPAAGKTISTTHVASKRRLCLRRCEVVEPWLEHEQNDRQGTCHDPRPYPARPHPEPPGLHHAANGRGDGAHRAQPHLQPGPRLHLLRVRTGRLAGLAGGRDPDPLRRGRLRGARGPARLRRRHRPRRRLRAQRPLAGRGQPSARLGHRPARVRRRSARRLLLQPRPPVRHRRRRTRCLQPARHTTPGRRECGSRR